MILYTPLTHQEIFQGQVNYAPQLECISYKGKMLSAEKLPDGSYRVERVLSSDPMDFLSPDLFPGKILQ